MISRSPPNSHRICRQAPHGGVGAFVSATTAMRENRRSPSEIALTMATRSAQIVRPYVAFSTLQPVMIRPSGVWRAAPTLNPEYGACAFSRTLRAASTRALVSIIDQDPRNGRVEQGGNETDEQRPSAKPSQIMPAIRSQGANAAELDADGRKIGESCQSKCREHVRSITHDSR